MPFQSLKLVPGVNLNDTFLLNEAGLSSSNCIRYIPDRALGAVPQKLGGWTKYYPSKISSIVRSLCAWEDTNAGLHLAFGSIGASGTAAIGVITSGTLQNIIPQNTTNASAALTVSATSGSATITITDTVVTGVTQYDSVYIATPIAIGGIVLFGLYKCGFLSNTTYTVQSTDVLGNLLPATSTSTSPTVPQIATTASSPIVSVTLANHGYSVGSTFTVLTSTTVGGSVFYGTYYVTGITSANVFTINAPTTPTSTATAYVNAGNAYYIYSFGTGAISTGTGFGVGGFGSGGFGTGTAVTPSLGSPIAATDWSLDNWGQVLISSPVQAATVPFQPIYQWDPTSGASYSTIISAAPAVNDSVFVAMPQRQLVALGSTFTGVSDPLLIRWCDVGNYNTWIGTVTNQAGSYRLPKGSKIVGGIQAPNQCLIWTDVDLWAMQYVGLPYVYSFNELAAGCGLIGKRAMGVIGGATFWMSQSQFFSYGVGGAGVTPVVCPIWDVIFQQIDLSNAYKIRCGVNSRFGEITWYYPTLSSGGEIGGYAKYNVALNVWDYGNIARSAWIDQSVLGAPIGADPSSLYIYQHETSNDADGAAMPASMQTGWFTIGDGESMTFLDVVRPDFKYGFYGATQNATVNMTFYVADYPGDTPKVFGPYAVTQSTKYISPRFRGRLVSIALSSSDVGTFWRLGRVEYRACADGEF